MYSPRLCNGCGTAAGDVDGVVLHICIIPGHSPIDRLHICIIPGHSLTDMLNIYITPGRSITDMLNICTSAHSDIIICIIPGHSPTDWLHICIIPGHSLTDMLNIFITPGRILTDMLNICTSAHSDIIIMFLCIRIWLDCTSAHPGIMLHCITLSCPFTIITLLYCITIGSHYDWLPGCTWLDCTAEVSDIGSL